MPNPGADAPLRKVTLNLYDADVEAAEQFYGRGWTSELRELWQAHMRNVTGYHKLRQQLGDLP
jgi:hypothetical protein